MTASTFFLGLFIVILVAAICWVDGKLGVRYFPSAEDEEKQAKRDMEDALKRVNRESQDRRRVRAGTN